MILLQTLTSFLKDKEYRSLLVTTSMVVTGGSIFYHFVEGWEWIDCFYFSIITLSTIGYGDFAPQTDAGKLFTIGYIILGMSIILSFINTLYLHYNSVKKGNKS
ncbi:potassium channel family protein [Bacteroidia bacterium]|nr:potassium channel family protein [Bacteroidia bacterium]